LVSAGRQSQDQPDNARQGQDPASRLSALEEALRRALASVPRDQVVKTIMTALPVEVLVDDTRLHGKVGR
jgi:hypothetical protein